MENRFVILFTILTLLLLTSCEGDCYDEEIEKVEWITSYDNKYGDTLVSYSITENKREYFEYYNEIKHTLTIRNNNSRYNGVFSLTIYYGTNNYYGEVSKEFDYVTIKPNSSYTFVYYSPAGKYVHYNSQYYISQRPVSFSYKQRNDKLKRETIIVNRCKENVEALREKYKSIEEMFKTKTKEKSRILN